MEENAKEGAVFRAMEENRLLDGVLANVPEAGADGPVWHLITEVRSDLLDTLRAEQSNAVIMSEVIGRENRTSFWVLGYQAASVQHRYLLPLVGPTVDAMIRHVGYAGIRLLMHSTLNAPTLEAFVPVDPDTHDTLRQHHAAITDAEAIFKDQANVIVRLLDPGFLTPIEGLPLPTVVSVTSVVTPELVRLADDWEQAAYDLRCASDYPDGDQS